MFSRKSRVSYLAVLIMVLTSILVVQSRARATPGVDDYPYKTHSWQEVDPWQFYKRECTSFVAWRLVNDNRLIGFRNTMTGPNGQTRTLGNASSWGTRAAEMGYRVDLTPAVGAVAWWSAGHVAWVKEVRTNTVIIEEYNVNYAHAYKSPHREISKGDVSGYIHFGGEGNSGATGVRLVGDFNGDGYADAAVMFREQGVARVSLSTGGYFGYPGEWSYGHSVGAQEYLAGDVNGDGRDDLVAYFARSRTWAVSLSSGGGFWPPTEWAYDGPLVHERVFLADVTGDGKDDKIAFAHGDWHVSVSSGTGFWAPQIWRSGHGVGSNDQLVGDFNNDRLTDAAVYFAANGKWHVGLSTGGGFGYPGEWSHGHGLGTTLRTAGDVTGDGKDDIVYYSQNIHKWWTGVSSGGGFWSLAEWSYDGAAYAGATNSFLADVDGDRRDDKILFFSNTGNWYVATSSGGGFWPLRLWISGHGAGS